MKLAEVAVLAIVAGGHYFVIQHWFNAKDHVSSSVPLAGTALEVAWFTLPEASAPDLSVDNTTLPQDNSQAPELLAVQSSLDDTFTVEQKPQKLKEIQQIDAPEPVMPTAKSQEVPTENARSTKNKTAKQPQAKPTGRTSGTGTRATKTVNGGDNGTQFSPPSHQGAALGNRRPKYPEQSLRKKEQGRVTLIAHVLPSGKASHVSIKQSSGFTRLDNAAQKAAEKYHYRPAMQHGKPIAYDYTFTITFSIQRK
ncbi:energy transducer TonB [Wohlfahrtiimonas chitiniclastica]|uniref:energy transducer TonB n=1 Tax=Wohlfahrtiimonas chitiniclastica TaxID=400946 RepID=UPI002157897D|nr:energy transducer TonB [Wohlfahrtiimonas chitiniclastica]MDC7252602.1 cell envelope biogenesis protein TonB [Wohlfahrtiimonas chitiniclastica]